MVALEFLNARVNRFAYAYIELGCYKTLHLLDKYDTLYCLTSFLTHFPTTIKFSNWTFFLSVVYTTVLDCFTLWT